MFLGHQQRTVLPLLPGQFDFQVEDAIKAAEKREKNRSQEYMKRRARELLPLKMGQKVRIQTKTGWDLIGRVTEAFNKDRSYNVITDAGAQIRRNRVMLRPVYELDADDENSADEGDNESGDTAEEAIPIHDPAPAPEIQHAEVPKLVRKSTRTSISPKPCSCCNTLVCKKIHGTS